MTRAGIVAAGSPRGHRSRRRRRVGRAHGQRRVDHADVTLEFSVVDAQAGVDSKTVAVELNQAKHPYTPTVQWTKTGDDYKFTFDSANVTGSKVQLTVNVSASDLAGNPSTGASLVLYLDNQPPIVDSVHHQLEA